MQLFINLHVTKSKCNLITRQISINTKVKHFRRFPRYLLSILSWAIPPKKRLCLNNKRHMHRQNMHLKRIMFRNFRTTQYNVEFKHFFYVEFLQLKQHYGVSQIFCKGHFESSESDIPTGPPLEFITKPICLIAK